MAVKVILMAGGKGERLWPKSRLSCPKQFTNLMGTQTLVEQSLARVLPLTRLENIYLSTAAAHKKILRQLLPSIEEQQFILEPMPKDTACAIALAALKIKAAATDILLFMPADSHIEGKTAYLKALRSAIELTSASGQMSLIGITPTHPSENYGYIQIRPEKKKNTKKDRFKVESFREKPNLDTAKEYLASGNYLWNSGIFLFVKAELDKVLQTQAPELIAHLKHYLKAVETEPKRAWSHYKKIEKISFDYAVVEKLTEINCVRGSFKWDDLGSWSALARNKKPDQNGNALSSSATTSGVRFFNTKNTLVDLDQQAAERLTVVLNGVEGLHVILNKNVLYVCQRERENNIKDILKQLKGDPELL